MNITPVVTMVQRVSTIRRQRLLPQPGEIVIGRGQQVTPVQVVARVAQQRGYVIIPAAEMLGVDPEEVKNYLLVEEGTALQRKKPLLEKTGILGGKRFASPVNGILDQVSNGRLIVQQTPELFELRAMLHGFVVATIGNQGVVIETEGALVQAAWSTGREGYGNINVVVEDPGETLTEEQIGIDARGSILVAGQIKDTTVLEKAEESSVRGIVLGHVPGMLAPSLGQFRFPILVTDGFGTGKSMSLPIFQMLQELHGREASLLAGDATGRPEIIVPGPATGGAESHRSSSITPPLQPGQRVRILRAPYAGVVGEILALHARARPTNVGLHLPGASVKLPDGQVVFVPNLNLDQIC